MSEVYSWNLASRHGAKPSLYSSEPADIPHGEYIATLDFKIWAGQMIAINCYFTKEDTQQKFQLSVARLPNTTQYTLDGIDFKTCAVGKYLLKVELMKQGKVKLTGIKAI